MEERGTVEGPDKTPPLDRRSARRHHQFPARHPAVLHRHRAGARGRDRRRRRLQSDPRRALHRREGPGRLRQQPAPARGGAQDAGRLRDRHRHPPPRPPAGHERFLERMQGVDGAGRAASAAPARPPSISPGWRRAASTAMSSTTSAPGTWRRAPCWCARPAGTSPTRRRASACSRPAASWPATPTIHKALLGALAEQLGRRRQSRTGLTERPAKCAASSRHKLPVSDASVFG